MGGTQAPQLLDPSASGRRYEAVREQLCRSMHVHAVFTDELLIGTSYLGMQPVSAMPELVILSGQDP